MSVCVDEARWERKCVRAFGFGCMCVGMVLDLSVSVWV